ncbi:Retinoblastoma- protein 1 [Terramyces sp. JEL0728]|nr:Retinoblastoma- protein 1 [Terramyces sp. JEL0728]
MKRQREEVEPTGIDRKATPEEKYLLYIRLRLRDNSAAVEEANPSRCENALFELSFHLSLSKDMRQQSFRYLEIIRRNGSLNIQSLFVQACACIWSAELALTKRNGLYPISVLLNVLHKVTKFVSESGHLLYEPVFFETFFNNFTAALQAIETTDPNLNLVSIAQSVYALYKQQMEKYHHYRTIFQALIRLENSDYSNLKADQFKTESMLDIFRYGWLLILLSDVDLKNQTLTNVVGVIGLVASHISSVRTMGELANKLPILPECSPELYDLPWTNHFKEVLELIRNYYKCDSNIYTDVEAFLQYLKANGLLLCTEEVLEPGSFWRIYKMSFDGGPQGLLQVNLQNIMSRLDKEFKPRLYQLDFIAFVPTWDRTIAAPKRFLRTPAQSTSKRSTMRNLCRVASVSSGLDNKMTVTPLSAMGQVGVKTGIKDDIRTILYQKFARIDIHSPQFTEQMPVYIQERATKIIETMKAQSPATRDVWEFALKIYYNFFIYLLNLDPDFRKEQSLYKEIAADGQFHRAVMCISMELARLAYSLNTVTFEALIRHCMANIVDLSLIVELLKEYVIKQPEWPRDVIKRLYELHERTTETELWTDPQFYQFLEFENTKVNENYQEFFAVSKSVLFFGYIQSKKKAQVTLGPHLAKYGYLDQSKFQGYLFLFHNAIQFANSRLESFFRSEQYQMSDKCLQRGKDILMECITNDHKYRLISNRHIDIIIICSIYLAGTIIAHKPEITFKGLVAQYEKFPQYFYKTVKQIYISNASAEYNNNCDIVEFYKSVFLPVLTPYLSLKENCEPQALSNAINFNFEMMKLNNDYLLTSPIRRDAMKTKKKLSFNSPGFSSPNTKSPMAYAPCTPSKLGQVLNNESPLQNRKSVGILNRSQNLG